MALDSVRPLALESPAEGGTQTYSVPTAINTLQDALAAAGLFIDGPTVSVADKTVVIDRASGGNLRLTDQATSSVLSDLMTVSDASARSHAQSRDIQHFLAGEGPGTGFASGSYCTRNFSGPLLTSEIWWASSAMTTKIFSKTYAYPAASPLPSTATYVMFSSTGGVLKTVVDSFSFSGLSAPEFLELGAEHGGNHHRFEHHAVRGRRFN